MTRVAYSAAYLCSAATMDSAQSLSSVIREWTGSSTSRTTIPLGRSQRTREEPDDQTSI